MSELARATLAFAHIQEVHYDWRVYMASVVENLNIQRMVVHEVPKRSKSDVPVTPVYSTDLTVLSPEGRDALQDRIVKALASNSQCVEVELSEQSINGVGTLSPDLVASSDNEFAAMTRTVADQLSQSQVSRQIPGGVLVVATGTVGSADEPFCAAIKAEVHTGFHKRSEEHSISAEFLSDLFLTPQQKLYKIGIFISPGSAVRAYVYDHNLTRSETTQLAKYFYQSFLGCEVGRSTKVQTQDFFMHTREFIDDLDGDPAIKLNYQDALYAYLRNENNTTIGVFDFAEQVFPESDRDTYVNYMREREFPEIAILKNNELIQNKLKRRVMSFSTGVRLIRGNTGSLSDVVRIIQSNGEETTLIIKGSITGQAT